VDLSAIVSLTSTVPARARRAAAGRSPRLHATGTGGGGRNRRTARRGHRAFPGRGGRPYPDRERRAKERRMGEWTAVRLVAAGDPR